MGSSGGCQFCPKGKYASSGSAACEACAPGRYGDKSTQIEESAACNLCAEGHYGDQPGATSRQCSGPCPKGSYSRPGALACELCPEGRYGDVVGSGVVGFTTPVCTGACKYADYSAPRGSTCCPKLVFCLDCEKRVWQLIKPSLLLQNRRELRTRPRNIVSSALA